MASSTSELAADELDAAVPAAAGEPELHVASEPQPKANQPAEDQPAEDQPAEDQPAEDSGAQLEDPQPQQSQEQPQSELEQSAEVAAEAGSPADPPSAPAPAPEPEPEPERASSASHSRSEWSEPPSGTTTSFRFVDPQPVNRNIPFAGPALNRNILSTSVDSAGAMFAGSTNLTHGSFPTGMGSNKPKVPPRGPVGGTPYLTPWTARSLGSPSGSSASSPKPGSARAAPRTPPPLVAEPPSPPLKVVVPGIPVPNIYLPQDAAPSPVAGAPGDSPDGQQEGDAMSPLMRPHSAAVGHSPTYSPKSPQGSAGSPGRPATASGRYANMPSSPQAFSARSKEANARGQPSPTYEVISSARGQRTRPNVVVDPQLIEFYTSRPPKQHTPNSTQPITTSDFKNTSSAPGQPPSSRPSSSYGPRPGSPGAAALGSRAGSARSLCFGHIAPRRYSQRTVPPVPGSAEAMALAGGSRPGTATSPSRNGALRSSGGGANGTGARSSGGGGSGGGAGGTYGSMRRTTTEGPPPLQPKTPAGSSTGALSFDLSQWLLPSSSAASQGPTGLFGGEEGYDNVPLLSRAVRALVQCDVGFAEVTEAFLFISPVDIGNLTFRFPVAPGCCLTGFSATIGGMMLTAEAVQRPHNHVEEDDEDEEGGPKGKKKGNKGGADAAGGQGQGQGAGARDPGGRRRRRVMPNLRAPIPRLKARQECLLQVTYVQQLQGAAGTLIFKHHASWEPPQHDWHVQVEPDRDSDAGFGVTPVQHSRARRKEPGRIYDLSYDLRVVSASGLVRVSATPLDFIITPSFKDTLIQLSQQVWQPHHTTSVTMELKSTIPKHSYAILQEAKPAVSAALALQKEAPRSPSQRPSSAYGSFAAPPKRHSVVASFSPAWHFSPTGGGLPAPEGLGSGPLELWLIFDFAGAMSPASVLSAAQALVLLLQDLPHDEAPSGATFNVMLLPGAAPPAGHGGPSGAYPLLEIHEGEEEHERSSEGGMRTPQEYGSMVSPRSALLDDGFESPGGRAAAYGQSDQQHRSSMGLTRPGSPRRRRMSAMQRAKPVLLFPGGCEVLGPEALAVAVAWVQEQLLSMTEPEELLPLLQPVSQLPQILPELCAAPTAAYGARRALLALCAAGAVYSGGDDGAAAGGNSPMQSPGRGRSQQVQGGSKAGSAGPIGGAPPPKPPSPPWLANNATVFPLVYGNVAEVGEKDKTSNASGAPQGVSNAPSFNPYRQSVAGGGGPGVLSHSPSMNPHSGMLSQMSSFGDYRGGSAVGMQAADQRPELSKLNPSLSMMVPEESRQTTSSSTQVRQPPAVDVSYLDPLARCHGGFLQQPADQSGLVAAGALAARCAVSGRYLRHPWVSAQGAILRNVQPSALPPAVPMTGHVQVLARVACLSPGAALELHGQLPDGSEVVMGVSLEPKDARVGGGMLPILQTLSEISSAVASYSDGSESEEAVRREVLFRALMYGLATPYTVMQLVAVSRVPDGTINVTSHEPTPRKVKPTDDPTAVSTRARPRPLRWVSMCSEPPAPPSSSSGSNGAASGAGASGGAASGGGAGAGAGAGTAGAAAPETSRAGKLGSSAAQAQAMQEASKQIATNAALNAAPQALAILSALVALREKDTGHWKEQPELMDVIGTLGRSIPRPGQPPKQLSAADQQGMEASKQALLEKLRKARPRTVPQDVWTTAVVLGYLRKHVAAYRPAWMPAAERAWQWLMSQPAPKDVALHPPSLVVKAAGIF